MSDTPAFYRCEKEHSDPCKYAKDGYRIPREEAIRSMDDSNVLLCPGKTESGKDCRSPLIALPNITPWWKRILPIVGGILALVVLIWFLMKRPDSPDDPVSPNTTSSTTSTPPPVSVTPPPPRDPWWVYEQLETTSNILRTEP